MEVLDDTEVTLLLDELKVAGYFLWVGRGGATDRRTRRGLHPVTRQCGRGLEGAAICAVCDWWQ